MSLTCFEENKLWTLSTIFDFGQKLDQGTSSYVHTRCLSQQIKLRWHFNSRLMVFALLLVRSRSLNPKKPGGGVESTHRMQISLVFLQFSSKLLKFFFDESCGISAFTKIFFEKLGIIEIGARGRWKRSSIFQVSHPSQVCSQKPWVCIKEFDLSDLSPKKNSESFDENWQNDGHFSKFG